jgi:hypothetical protein
VHQLQKCGGSKNPLNGTQTGTSLSSVPKQTSAASPAAGEDVHVGLPVFVGHTDVLHNDEHEIHTSSRFIKRKISL